ncbi:MAG: hypothetical protein IPK50_09575 [Fibrobacterota bacterium]|nr:hypothetical protein [Fibrobacterota bacterium]QQS07128.1 MAG: hypothetical protein IPK50_09575 [Fibrobacterota bacterium]
MRESFAALPALGLCLVLAAEGQAYQSPDLSGVVLFPPDNPWHFDVSQMPLHPNSANLVNSVGASTSLHPDFGSVYDGVPFGIPYMVVGSAQPKLAVGFDYADESDPGPYPAPLNAPIEGGSASDGDRHVLVVDTSAKVLWEMWDAHPQTNSWTAGSGAKFDLTKNDLRPEGWTSADAAGLPVLAGLVRYDEIRRGVIDHAIRMTVATSRKSYIWPARHQAGSTTNANAPAMGERFRLKANFDTAGFPPAAKTVIMAMKKYGLIVADNGSNWYISGAPDDRMPDDELNTLKAIKGRDFEAVLSVDSQGKPIIPGVGNKSKHAIHPALGQGNGRRHDALGRESTVPPENDVGLVVPFGNGRMLGK